MKKNLSSIIISLFLFVASTSVFAVSKKIVYNDYSVKVFYPEYVQPGDAVFIRLECDLGSARVVQDLESQGKKNETASLELFKKLDDENLPEKPLAKAKFYKLERHVTKESINSVLFVGVPLSTYEKAGECVAKITYSVFDKGESTVTVPVKIFAKDFVSETLDLDSTNTAIKTDSSDERKKQIDRLNKILGAKHLSAVYETHRFAVPNPAKRITSNFGDRRVYKYTNGKSSESLHYGIDYGVPTGNKVRACGRGKVVMAENRISTGWSVCIEHLPGLYSLYYHMDKLNVEVGKIVNQGDLIGVSGATGLATGPHLHWEVRLNMEAINPDFMLGDFAFSEESALRKYN